MKPTLHKPSWTVWTTEAIYSGGYVTRKQWMWAAFGPRGQESGVEETADGAAHKARCAAELLREPEPASVSAR